MGVTNNQSSADCLSRKAAHPSVTFGLKICEFVLCHCEIRNMDIGQLATRQLPIGAGYCQWGGFTDRNVCNIDGEEHQAHRSNSFGRRERYGRKEGKLGNI